MSNDPQRHPEGTFVAPRFLVDGFRDLGPTSAARREMLYRNWLIVEAAIPLLDAIDDPVQRAILDLHSLRDDRDCDGVLIWSDWEEREAWPCATVRIVAAAHGIELPDEGEEWEPPIVIGPGPLTGDATFHPELGGERWTEEAAQAFVGQQVVVDESGGRRTVGIVTAARVDDDGVHVDFEMQ